MTKILSLSIAIGCIHTLGIANVISYDPHTGTYHVDQFGSHYERSVPLKCKKKHFRTLKDEQRVEKNRLFLEKRNHSR